MKDKKKEAAYQLAIVELRALNDAPLETVDQFFTLHEPGTSMVVLVAMLVLAMRAKEEPFFYWLEYDEEKFLELVSFTHELQFEVMANRDNTPWEEIMIHHQPMCRLAKIDLH